MKSVAVIGTSTERPTEPPHATHKVNASAIEVVVESPPQTPPKAKSSPAPPPLRVETSLEDGDDNGGSAHQQRGFNCCKGTKSKDGHPASPKSHEAGHVTCILSGLIVGIQIFVFCCVFAEMMFGQNAMLQPAVPLGVGMQTMSTMIGALIFAKMSGCRAVIAGPDITPVVFLSEAAAIVSARLCPDGATLDCARADEAAPTVLAATLIATCLVGGSFLLLGKLRLTVIVGFIPASVVSGFLSCIGYKVLKASVEIACPVEKNLKFQYYSYFFGSMDGSWQYLLPAIPIGVPLYLLKRYHLGRPTLNFPFFILVPTAIFYVAVYGGGWDVETARANGWLFPRRGEPPRFWDAWEGLYGGLAAEKVSGSALIACVPAWLVMLLIVNLDNMLKLASTEAALAIDFDYNHEMKVGGIATLLNGLLGGSPAYGQTKFNVLNYGITHSTSRNLPSVVCALFCGVLFFSGLPLIDYLPRFMLSGLLLFSATGFLVENLIDTRKKFHVRELSAVWAVFIINVIGGEYLPQLGLLIAIGSGLVWGLVTFAVHFARRSQTLSSNHTISGEVHCSSAYRSAAQEAKLGVLGVWYTIMRLDHSYIFFGTAALLHRRFKAHIAQNALRARCERTKMIILDMASVDAMDSTAGSIFVKAQRLARSKGITLVWAGLEPRVEAELLRSGVALSVASDAKKTPLLANLDCTAKTSFANLDKAEKWVEDRLLEHVHKLAQRWLVDKTCRDVYNRALLHDALTTTHSSLHDGAIGPSQLLRWSRRHFVPKGKRILVEGEPDDGLYLLYRGHVDVSEGVAQEAHTIYPGALFNEHVLYSPPETGALFTATAAEDSVLLRIGYEQRQAMQRQSPMDAYYLLLTVFKQVELRNPARRHHTWLEQAGVEPSAARKSNLLSGSGGSGGGGPPSPPLAATVSRFPFISSTSTTTNNSVEELMAADNTGNAPSSSSVAGAPGVTPFANWARRRSSDNRRSKEEAGAGGGLAGELSPGVVRRRTVKALDQTRRMTDRDLSMRHMVQIATKNDAPAAAPSPAPAAATAAAGGFGLGLLTSALMGGGGGGGAPTLAAPPAACTGSLRESSDPSPKAKPRLGSFEHDARSCSGGSHSGGGGPGGGGSEPATREASEGDALVAVQTPRRERSEGDGLTPRGKIGPRSGRPSRRLQRTLSGPSSNKNVSPRMLASPRHASHDHWHREFKLVDAEFLKGGDYRVPLTPSQREHYSRIFELNDHSDRNLLQVSELASFMDSLGHGVPVAELEQMMHDLGIVEDENHAIELDAFLEFMRRTLVADLPRHKMSKIHEVFKRETTTGSPAAAASAAAAAAAATAKTHPAAATPALPPPLLAVAPAGPEEEAFPHELPLPSTEAAGAAAALATKVQVAAMLKTLGFLLDELSLAELFDELDADTDGRLSEDEFITCIGMIKANLVEIMHLEQSFTRFRRAADRAAGSGLTPPASPNKPPSNPRLSSGRATVASSTPDNMHVVRASDLVAALNVTLQEAEEMIFIADLKDNQSIDFTEFKQVVVNWSG